MPGTTDNEFLLNQKEQQAENDLDQKTNYYTISESSTLPMTVAREFINERHARPLVTDADPQPWMDPATGRVTIYEARQKVPYNSKFA